MLGWTLIAAGGVVILYCLASTAAVGMVPFTNLLCAGGAVLLLLGILEHRFGETPLALKLKKVLLPLAAAGLAVFLVLEGLIIAGAAKQDREPADYLLVLGAGLRGDEMSLTLQNRMDTALAYESGETIVVSGGQGHNELIPEAEAMGDYLVEQGIPESRIIREERSTSTMENLLYSKELIEKDSGKPITELRIRIVSSDFHAFRIRMLAKRAGYGEIGCCGAETPAWTVPSSYIREAAALVKSFFLDR